MSTPKKKPLKDKVKDWLLKEGYPLEMQSAIIFEEAGFQVSQGNYYEDPQTKKAREVDLVASLGKIIRDEDAPNFFESIKLQITFRFIVECKSSKRYPWILFSTTKKQQQRWQSWSLSGDASNNVMGNLEYIEGLPKTGFFKGPERTAHGVTIALKDKNRDLAYSAVLKVGQALKQAKTLTEHPPIPRMSKYHLKIETGLVVVDGFIFDAHLSMKRKLQLEKTHFERLRWKREGIRSSVNIDICTLSYLPKLLKTATDELDLVIEACESNPDLYQKNIPLESLFKPHRKKLRQQIEK
jgi:hypothetical protein